jgi:hypothetical protein
MKSESRKYFAVTAHGGHVGKGRYIPLTFAVAASNKKEAVNRVLGRDGFVKRPRVKIGRDGSATVEDVHEISHSEYAALKKENKNDPYRRVHNRQEQEMRVWDLDERVIVSRDRYALVKPVLETSENVALCGKEQIRNNLKWLKRNPDRRISIVPARRHRQVV